VNRVQSLALGRVVANETIGSETNSELVSSTIIILKLFKQLQSLVSGDLIQSRMFLSNQPHSKLPMQLGKLLHAPRTDFFIPNSDYLSDGRVVL
jgi:hypothetical protein